MKYKQNLHIDGSKVFSYETHVATIDRANGKLLVHGHWSVTASKHVNHVAHELRLAKVDAPRSRDHSEAREESDGSGLLKSVAMVASLASVFCDTPKDSNDWKARMLKAGLSNRGLSMPENWDSLSEAEKAKRLDGAIAAIA